LSVRLSDFLKKIEKTENGQWKIVRLDVENRTNPRLLQLQNVTFLNYLFDFSFSICEALDFNAA
jgi:hypothetical protein